jgi:hypothetical protein
MARKSPEQKLELPSSRYDELLFMMAGKVAIKVFSARG